MLVRRDVLLPLVGALALWLTTATALAEAAAIRGQILYAGPPQERTLPVTIDQYVCGKEKPAEDLIVGTDKGIKNAVVWLRTPPEGAAPSEPLPAKVEMDQKECVFIPRVVVVPVGGTVDFLNSDRLLHNVHSASKENPSFNRTQPRGRTIPITFQRPEIVRVNCDLHSWMRAWVVVAEHPFYAVTDAAGEFTLPNVPPGKYTLEVWQEKLGTTTQDVTVDAQDARVVIELKAPR